MAIRLHTAARFLCERCDWSLSNLHLQKLIYLAQVEHAGRASGDKLVDAMFQAWDYGPVVPVLYRQLKMFGADPVEDVFYDALRLRDNSPSKVSLETVLDQFGSAEPGELIELTHWEHGAWAKKYEPGQRGIVISQNDICGEAANRNTFAQEWRSITAN